jgi:PadR family transcriptional regulator, regulatory protein PadR
VSPSYWAVYRLLVGRPTALLRRASGSRWRLRSCRKDIYLCRVLSMKRVPRMTLQVQLVLRVMLADPRSEYYGLQLCGETGLPGGTIYPIVARLEGLGWVASNWEDPSEHVAEGRPRRRYYRLTDEGAEQARYALARASSAGKQPRASVGVLWPDPPGIPS